MLKISIITPSFNQGKYIEDTIRSISGQGYENFEHIVVDGGSTDNTIEVLKKNDHLKWVSEKDRGQTHAINKGLDMATGDILNYLNSDDMLSPGSLMKVNDYFRENSGTDLVYGNCTMVDDKGKEIKLRRSEDFDLQRFLYLGYSYIQQPTVFFRRGVFEEIGYFDEGLDFVMDYDYWIRTAIKNKELKYLDTELALMRIHGEAKTVSANKDMFKEAFKTSKKYGGSKIPRYYFHYIFWFILTTFPGLFKLIFNLRNKGRIK